MPNLVPIFAALSDETRFKIVDRLLTEGDLPAGAISKGFTISAPAVSRHLAVLRKAGVVEQKVSGTHRIYTIRPEALQAINEWVEAHKEIWSGRLERLERLVQNGLRR